MVAPLASYNLYRIVPASEMKFLFVAAAVGQCAAIGIRTLSYECARKLTRACGYIGKGNKTTNHIFHHINGLFAVSLHLLFPLIARTAGQRMGIQVPGYLQTIGHSSLVGCVVRISAEFLIAAEAIRKPATK